VVKFKRSFFCLATLLCSRLCGQDFTGFVKNDDGSATAIYQAKIEITEAGRVVSSLKTYFDGSFKFSASKNQQYTIHISYPGCVDTAYTITTDNKGRPDPAMVTVKLKKDGMRLVGSVKSAGDDFPIKDVTVIVKNSMTRGEERQTTGVAGRYNFKLDYETNYMVNVDKRSPGVFNKYRDTTVYVATVGFNQPIDYKMDLILIPDTRQQVEMPEGYNSSKVPVNTNLKPIVSLTGAAQKPAPLIVAENRPFTTAKALDSIKDIGPPKDITKQQYNDSLARAESAARNKQANDSVAAEIELQKRKQAELAEQKRKAQEENAKINYIDSIDRVVVGAKQKLADDSMYRAKQEKEKTDRELAIKKARADSVNAAHLLQRRREIEDSVILEAEVAKKNATRDSVVRVAAQQQKLKEELAAKKALADSTTHAINEQNKTLRQLASQKAFGDSIVKVYKELSLKVKRDSVDNLRANREKEAQMRSKQKAFQDSLSAVLNEARLKILHDSVANARAMRLTLAANQAAKKALQDANNKVVISLKQKIVSDSILHVKIEKEMLARQAIKQKVREDSLLNIIAQQKRQIAHAGAISADDASKRKILSDSLALFKTRFNDASKELVLQKQLTDSLVRAGSERTVVAKVLPDTKTIVDSISNALKVARNKIVEDSIAKAKIEKQRASQNLATQKALHDSTNKVIASLRQKIVSDSLLAVKADKEKMTALALKQKTCEDSLVNIIAQQKRQIAHAAATAADNATGRKILSDSLGLFKTKFNDVSKELVLQKQLSDSLARSGSEKTVAAKALPHKTALIDSLSSALKIARNKITDDSIAKANIEKQHTSQNLATQKALHDSTNKVIASLRQKIVNDSLLNIKAEKEKMTALVLKQKVREDSLVRVIIAERKQNTADVSSMANNADERKELADSLASVKARLNDVSRELQLKKQFTDSLISAGSIKPVLAKAAPDNNPVQDSINNALKIARNKIVDDSIANAKAERQHLVEKLRAQKAYEDSLSNAYNMAFYKAAQDSLERLKAERERQEREWAARVHFQDSISQVLNLAHQAYIKDSVALAMAGQLNQPIAPVVQTTTNPTGNGPGVAVNGKPVTPDSLTAQNTLPVAQTSNIDTGKQAQAIARPIIPAIYESDTPLAGMKAVYFDKNICYINKAANKQLDELSDYLLAHPTEHLDIYALASADENNAGQTSMRRSEIVIRYFVEAGVSMDRVKSFNLGNKISRNACTNANCPEELLQQNRCVVYQIVK
jgi:hypothetical protein